MKLNKVLMSVATMAGVVAAGSVAANADTVTVQQGDTVWGFAQETNSTVAQIAQQNNLQNPNLIFVGQQLQIGQTVQQANAQAAAAQAQANAEAQAAAAQQAQDAAAQAAKEQQQAAAAQAQANAEAQAQQEAQQKAAEEAAQQQAQAEAAAKAAQQKAQAEAAAKAAQQKQNEEQQYAQQQNRVNYNNANQTVQRVVQSTQASASNNTSSDDGLDAANAAARAWIVARESGGNYNATNGNYYGKYQLSRSYLNGDYSPANQDRVANQYVSSRYGSWVNAENHWKQCGWY